MSKKSKTTYRDTDEISISNIIDHEMIFNGCEWIGCDSGIPADITLYESIDNKFILKEISE